MLCLAKVSYTSEQSAQRAKAAMERARAMNPDVLTIFQCEACREWHIAHKVRGNRATA